VYNLGGREPVSLLQIVETLKELNPQASYKLVPFPPEKKRIDIGDYYGDYSRIRTALGWQPQVSLREGLSKTIEYYRQYKEHYWE
jgi:UDP-glucose 4-epimerase